MSAGEAKSSAAHPRSRGEHLLASLEGLNRQGSSPLTRGALSWAKDLWDSAGLIPAHAGSTAAAESESAAQGAHPRSRGEHGGPGARAHRPHGSSPLTRGARPVAVYGGAPLRLIPAHAGSTAAAPTPPHGEQAHPRSRGEHNSVSAPSMGKMGSSPLTRGALHDGSGNFSTSLGSSPLTRGAREDEDLTADDVGLIPAHAGSTWNDLVEKITGTAHPRSRGEHLERGKRYNGKPGSSPLTRGARISTRCVTILRGLIPAHAGSTGLTCTNRVG